MHLAVKVTQKNASEIEVLFKDKVNFIIEEGKVTEVIFLHGPSAYMSVRCAGMSLDVSHVAVTSAKKESDQ